MDDRAFQDECEKKRRNGKVLAVAPSLFPGVPPQSQEVVKTITNKAILFEVFLTRVSMKCSVPAAEWYVILRNLRCMSSFTFIDSENGTVGFFRPYIHQGKFDVSVEIQPIEIGPRFKNLTNGLT